MKVTKQPINAETGTTQTVCEIAQYEFTKLTSQVAAATIKQITAGDDSADAMLAGLAMAATLARFAVNLEKTLFNLKDQNENTDKQEEK